MGKISTNKHIPTVLTIAGVCGVFGTAIMAVKATPKALKMLQMKKNELKEDEELSKVDTFLIVWKCYIPSFVIGLSTTACIIGIHVLDKRNQASLASAYAMLRESYKQYRDAVKQVYGEDADARIKAEIAKDTWVSSYGISLYSPDADASDKMLFYDFFSKRYFEATFASVINAEYHLNRNLMLRGYSTINEFYDFLGLENTEYGDELGWVLDNLVESCGSFWLDFENQKTQMDDGMECFIVSTIWEPEKIDSDYI